MIRGYFAGLPGRRRPYVDARVRADVTGRTRDVSLLIDTGADRGVLSLRDAEALGLVADLLPKVRAVGVGGTVTAGSTEVLLTLGRRRFRVRFRVLPTGDSAQRTERERLPSILGSDVLSHFGLYIEERRDLVLLLEPDEAARLPLP